jgi:hypothetical protein
MKGFFLAVFFCCCNYLSYSQNAIGIPDIINYPKQVYNAGTQSWDVKQDKNGILYFANNDGLLTFDGNYWKVFKLPAKTHVRCIEIGRDQKHIHWCPG